MTGVERQMNTTVGLLTTLYRLQAGRQSTTVSPSPPFDRPSSSRDNYSPTLSVNNQ
uniref:Uncharacterized protein n=1 Tax=Heterorhabditis bacteriophora TaxID=37862 RepID=A0A1I7WY59_HETBA